MKHPRTFSIIVAKPLANGLGLLLLSSMLASCQKTVIQKKGLFTHISQSLQNQKLQGRFPASSHKNFVQFQDPKQIYIFCELNNSDKQACFSKHLNESLEQFALMQNTDERELARIKEIHSFEKARLSTMAALKRIFTDIHPQIDKLVEKRSSFCKENATLHLERCLRQYLNKETLQVLNDFQERKKEMNGREYLYLKKHIQSKFQDKLENAQAAIEKNQKKKLLTDFEKGLKDAAALLLQNRKWLEDVSTLVGAKNACVDSALKAVATPSSIPADQAREMALEKVCLDILNSEQIKTIVDHRAYAAFEVKLKEFEKTLTKSADDWTTSCDGENRLEFLSCLSRVWPAQTDKVFERWASSPKNKKFKNQKGLFIMRANNNASKIKRAIASQKEF